MREKKKKEARENISRNVKDHLSEEVARLVYGDDCFPNKFSDTISVLAIICVLYEKGLIAMRYAK